MTTAFMNTAHVNTTLMNTMAITGVGTLSAAGRTVTELSTALAGPRPTPADTEDPLPGGPGFIVPGFDIRAELGRKGTSFFDRRTGLTVVACRAALDDASVELPALDRARVGVVLGTTAGSVRSSVDYAMDTFVQDRPYMVNAGLFPTTVMNCAASQAAIWFGLRGVNATIAGGAMAMLAVLRYSENLLRTGRTDVVLAGVIDELTPHAAWLARTAGLASATHPGEGGAMFVLTASGPPRPPAQDGEVLGVALGFSANLADRPAALGGCVRRALAQAARAGADVGKSVGVLVRQTADEREDRAMWRAVCAAVAETGAPTPDSVTTQHHAGDCGSATAALDLAAVLGRHRDDPQRDGELSVLVSHSADGAVGAAVVRGWSSGAHRR